MQWNKPSIRRMVILLGPLVASVALSMDVFLPAIPKIKHVLAAQQTQVQMTLSLFLFVSGLGQLFIGPMSDARGRRRLLLMGLVIFCIGSLCCAASQTIHQLIAARVLAAIGGCTMTVVSFAIIRDLFDGEDCGRTYSYLNSVVAISPLFAPFVGAYLDVTFGWRSLFIFLALLGVLGILIAFLFIPESLSPEHRTPVKRDCFKRYWLIFKNTVFLRHVFCCAAGIGMLFSFFSLSSFLIIDVLKIPEMRFSFYFGVMGLNMMMGGFIGGQLIKRFGIHSTIRIGAAILLFGGASMLWWHHLYGLSLAGFIVPINFIALGATFLIGAGAGGAMTPFKETAGSAAALMGFLQFFGSSAIGTLVMLKHATNALPLGIAATACALIALTLFRGKSA